MVKGIDVAEGIWMMMVRSFPIVFEEFQNCGKCRNSERDMFPLSKSRDGCISG